MKFNNTDSEWKFLDEFRGKDFNGTWPTLVEMFNISTKRYPDNPCFSAITPKKESFTYSEAHSIITKLGNYLVRLGVKKGDRIAVTGKNSPQWAIAYLGILYSGAIVVPIDYSLHASEIEHLLEFAGVKMLFIDKERIEEIDSDNKLGLLARFSLEEGDMNHKFILDCQEDEDLNREKVTESDTAAILFTSGTTGTPKGVMLSHGNFVSDCYIAQSQMHLYPTDVFYAILPIHHAYTMLAVLIETISVGASCLFGKKLVISQVLRELKEGKVTMFLGVPMLFNKMIAALMKGVREKGILAYCFIRMGMGLSGFIKKVFHVNVGKKWFGFLLKRLSLDTSRICICGGGPLPSSTFKLFNELGIDFVQGYGLTEASPITHLNPVEHFIVTSVGRAFPGEEVKIVNPDSEGNGIIFIKGPNVMQGYYHNREATDAVLDKDGWLNTGDVGHQDENRFLYLTGREKNIIVTEGGKNVFPEEIEDHFQLYDDIETICIMGYMVDKATRSEGIRALIYPSEKYVEQVVKTNPTGSEKEIQHHMEELVSEVNRQLQHYKKITRVSVVKEPLPLTSTRKVKRFIVAKQYKD